MRRKSCALAQPQRSADCGQGRHCRAIAGTGAPSACRLVPNKSKRMSHLTSKDRVHLVQGGAGVWERRRWPGCGHCARRGGRLWRCPRGAHARERRRPVGINRGCFHRYSVSTAVPAQGGSAGQAVRCAGDGGWASHRHRPARAAHHPRQPMDMGKLVLASDIARYPPSSWQALRAVAAVSWAEARSPITCAREPAMQAINRALQGDAAFAVLKPATTEVASGNPRCRRHVSQPPRKSATTPSCSLPGAMRAGNAPPRSRR